MSISHRARRAWMSVCLVPSAIFCKLKNEGSWGATLLRQILFQIGKNFYGDFSDVATGLWRGLLEPYAMPRVVPAFQIGQKVHRRRPQIWTAFHVNGRRSLKGRRFQAVEETEENTIRDLRAMQQNTFQEAFQNWRKHRARCIKSGGEYSE